MNSHNKFNYFLRPAKCVERRMICHTLQRLSSFSALKNYQYIGLGALFFYDFILFHRELNINSMHSIQNLIHNDDYNELTIEQQKIRFQNNVPFKCVQMHFGTTSRSLLNLDLNKPSIIWLDYDNKMNKTMTDDINYISKKICSGSVFFMSCNVYIKFDANPNEEFINFSRKNDYALIKRCGITRDLFSEENGRIVAAKRIFDYLIESTINNRNRSLEQPDKINYKQLYFFTYQDNALMVTLGGIFVNNRDLALYNNCHFEHFDFLNLDVNSSAPFHISIPNFTIKEIKDLNIQLPALSNSYDPNASLGIPKDELLEFSKIYRYMPTYSELFI